MQVPVSIVESEPLADIDSRFGWERGQAVLKYLELLRALDAGRSLLLEPEILAAYEEAGLLARDGVAIYSPVHEKQKAELEARRKKNRERVARQRARRKARGA